MAFVCQNFTCQAPTSEPAKVRELLQQRRGPTGASAAGSGPLKGTVRLNEVDISSLTGKSPNKA